MCHLIVVCSTFHIVPQTSRRNHLGKRTILYCPILPLQLLLLLLTLRPLLLLMSGLLQLMLDLRFLIRGWILRHR